MTEPHPPADLIWATRGRHWGFRFLLDAGLPDPLPQYEAAFAGVPEAESAWRRDDDRVALRLQDPLHRNDASGRVIPHEFVILDGLAERINSIDRGIELVWPLVAEAYAKVWDSLDAPTAKDLEF